MNWWGDDKTVENWNSLARVLLDRTIVSPIDSNGQIIATLSRRSSFNRLSPQEVVRRSNPKERFSSQKSGSEDAKIQKV